MAGPVGQETWGNNPNQPIAPNNLSFADKSFRPDLKGQDWVSAYVADITASPPTLNEARRHRWYALPPLNDLVNEHSVQPRPTNTSIMQSLEEKQKQDMPALLDELDERFATLTRLADEAVEITLPSDYAILQGPIQYCNWVSVLTPPSTLTRTLLSRCIQDRDAYLNHLTRRLAELTPLPTLPAPSPLPRYQLSRAVIPADQTPGFDAQHLFDLYRSIYAERLAGNYRALVEVLQRAVESLDKSDHIRAAEVECRVILGGYETDQRLSDECRAAVSSRISGRLTRVQAVMLEESRSELQAARDNPTIPPAWDAVARCRAVLGRFFEFESPYLVLSPILGVTNEQSEDLLASCRAGVIAINQVTDQRRAEVKAAADRATAKMLDRIVATGLGQLPQPTDGTAWKLAKWFPLPPRTGLTSNELSLINGAGWQLYQARWQAETAVPRKAAVTMLIEQIDDAFANGESLENAKVAALCAGQTRSQGDNLFGEALGIRADPSTALNEMATFRRTPGLTANQAQSWVTDACRIGYEQLAARRLEEVTAKAGTAKVFVAGAPLWVSTPDGQLQKFDPAELVRDAAIDGIQIAYEPGGFFSSPKMIVTPIGRVEPRLTGKLSKVFRTDGVSGLAVDLPSLPGLDGPAETLACLAMAVERSAYEGVAGAAISIVLGGLSNMPLAGGRAAQRGLDQASAARTCYEAKLAFKG